MIVEKQFLLQNVAVDNSEIKELKKLVKVEEIGPPKRRLRSNFDSGDQPAKRLRTDISTDELKENKIKAVRKIAPFIKYKGEIKYFTEFNDIAAVSDELL